MIVLYFVLVILLFLIMPCKINLKQGINESYLSKNDTLPIKGFFVALVLFRHVRDYITLSNNVLDTSFSIVESSMGQLIVAMFLFYSGYGIYESYKFRCMD